MKKFCLALHGGAGTILKTQMSDEKEKAFGHVLEDAVKAGYEILKKGGTSINAVIAAVIELENCSLFNAGKGSVFTNEGNHEMDASIMEGRNLSAGAVAGCRNIKNPVLLAKAIMEKTDNVMLSGEGAEEFARKIKLQFEDDNYFFDQLRYNQWLEIKDSEKTILDHTEKKLGTVGAVALDKDGNVAAATSTGGMTNKRFGRVGDTPLIGAGTYANNNTCAVSCTGHGEFFIRGVVAYDISCLMEYKNFSLKQACEFVVHEKLKNLGGEGGLIALDANGNIEMVFNSEGMYRASMRDEQLVVEIY
jgi:beta-aspartyl-peptidase (threonine type)